MPSSLKGSAFERKISEILSLWWSDNTRTDIFYRTSGSGARAKKRGRAGKSTAGQHGDISAIDPVGKPLIDVFTIELKCGYPKATLQDLLDKPDTAKLQKWEEWIHQATESRKHACSCSWMLIVKRDRREILVAFPSYIYDDLQRYGASLHLSEVPRMTLQYIKKKKKKNANTTVSITVMRLDDFILNVTPSVIQCKLDNYLANEKLKIDKLSKP